MTQQANDVCRILGVLAPRTRGALVLTIRCKAKLELDVRAPLSRRIQLHSMRGSKTTPGWKEGAFHSNAPAFGDIGHRFLTTRGPPVLPPRPLNCPIQKVLRNSVKLEASDASWRRGRDDQSELNQIKHLVWIHLQHRDDILPRRSSHSDPGRIYTYAHSLDTVNTCFVHTGCFCHEQWRLVEICPSFLLLCNGLPNEGWRIGDQRNVGPFASDSLLSTYIHPHMHPFCEPWPLQS